MERYILANLEREFGGVKPMNNIEILEQLEKMQQTFMEDGLQGYEMAIVTAKNLINRLIQENKELKDTLKQTQDSWYEDTKKIELNNEYEIALNNRILDLEQENKELKEKLQQYKKIEEIANTITDDDIRNAIKNAEKDYIPKSKVKEVMHGLNRNIASVNDNSSENYKYAKRLLQELLEEGE